MPCCCAKMIMPLCRILVMFNSFHWWYPGAVLLEMGSRLTLSSIHLVWRQHINWWVKRNSNTCSALTILTWSTTQGNPLRTLRTVNIYFAATRSRQWRTCWRKLDEQRNGRERKLPTLLTSSTSLATLIISGRRYSREVIVRKIKVVLWDYFINSYFFL